MLVYNYHPDTGVYIGSGDAQPSPAEPGKYLIPAWATDKEPPANTDPQKVVVFKDSDWVVEDVPQPDQEPEPTPEPEPDPEPEPTPEEKEAAAWAALRAERDRRLKDPFITDRLDRYRNQRDGNLPTTDTPEWFQAELLYLQALRDLPEKTTDPADPVWPQPPE